MGKLRQGVKLIECCTHNHSHSGNATEERHRLLKGRLQISRLDNLQGEGVIHEVDRVNPVADTVTEYKKWFKEYQTSYTALAPGFKRIAELLGE